MADGENKRAGPASTGGSIEPDEPVLKRPRVSIDPSSHLDNGASVGTEPAESEPAVTDQTDQASVKHPEPGRTAEPEMSELIDEGLHSNGFISPDRLHDDDEDDDRSSRASSSDWTPQPQIGSYRFIQQHIMRGTDPREILKDLLPETTLPLDLDDMTLWQIIINISEPPKRKKRKDINTLEDVVRLLNEGKKILVLTGAGVSVSCGIPDFRSRDGIYARLAVDFPDLPDPQAMFDIEYFKRDPRPFFKFAKEIYPGQFQPSPCHRFISMLDKKGRLLRNYTQNIDTLEQAAGIQKIIQCHGSFATASCLVCKHKVDCEAIREDIFNQVVPHCLRCPSDIPYAIMKPDIVFFGENLPEFFHRAMKQDKDEVDLLIVIGSSLKVRPVALIPSSVPHEVPQVLINREPLPHLNFDVELLGDCDVIINELCHRLGGDFEQLCFNSSRLSEIREKPPATLPPPPEPLSAESTSAEDTNASVHSSALTDSSEITRLTNCQNAPAHKTDEITSSPEASKTSPLSETLDRQKTDPSAPSPESQVTNSHSVETTATCAEKSDSCKNPASDATEAESATDDAQRPKEEEPRDHRRVEMPRRCWRSRIFQSPISKRLGASQYLFQTPNRYIFHGAEVYSSSEDETSSSCSSDSEASRCSADGYENEDSDVEEEGGSVILERNTEGCLEETVQENEHKGLQTDCTTDTNLQTTTDL
nr:NAD-dependent protein deacetylase sirtuin-1 [Misgurnus anguillicaudatus]